VVSVFHRFHHGGTENSEVAQRTTQIRTLAFTLKIDYYATQ